VELGGLRRPASAAKESEQRTTEKTRHEGGFWGCPWSPVVAIDRRWNVGGARQLHRETEEVGRGEGEQGRGEEGYVCVLEKGADIYNTITVWCCSPLPKLLSRLIHPYIPLFP